MFNVLNVTEKGCTLSVKDGCVFVQKKDGNEYLFPPEDLQGIIFEETAVNFTGALLELTAQNGIPLIFCDAAHQPCMSLNIYDREGGDFQYIQSLQHSTPPLLKKKIWKKLILHKIRGQSENLRQYRSGEQYLQKLMPHISNGDPENIEGRAAAFYWRKLALFPCRKRDADDANMFFNYAYTILYSAFARWICIFSMNPALGIHHHGKYNHFVLASDLMEPYRPLADRCVLACIKQYPQTKELNKEMKNSLLSSLYSLKVEISGSRRTIFDAAAITVNSYKECLKQKRTGPLLLPEVE